MGIKIGKALGTVAGAVAGGPMLAPITGALGSTIGGGGSIGDFLGTSGRTPSFDPYAAQRQTELAEIMRKRSMGEMPSYAETATRNALQENLSAQQAGIRSIGGVSGALKQRMIANAAGRTGSEIARRGGEAALQERNDAMNQYGGLLNNMRGAGAEEESIRQGAFESKQAGKRQLISSVGQGLATVLGGKGK